MTQDIELRRQLHRADRPRRAREWPNNTSSALTLHEPGGTTIADFALTRQIGYDEPGRAPDTHKLLPPLHARLDPLRRRGRLLRRRRATRSTRRSTWYGYPEDNVAIAKSTVTPRELPRARAATPGDAEPLVLRVGCYNRGTPCSVAAGGAISHILHGSDITINDPTAPTRDRRGLGLLAGGPRNGSDPVTVSASDNAGIRRVELIDVTNPARPSVVGVEDYAEVRTDANRDLRLQPPRAMPRPEPRDDPAHRRCPPASARASCA